LGKKKKGNSGVWVNMITEKKLVAFNIQENGHRGGEPGDILNGKREFFQLRERPYIREKKGVGSGQTWNEPFSKGGIDQKWRTFIPVRHITQGEAA